MKLRHIIVGLLLLAFLGVTTCNYLGQKKNQERQILDDKAIPK